MLTFDDFVHKYNLKNRATSDIKIYEVLKKMGLDSKVGIYLRDGDFSTSYGVVNLHPSRGTHWVCYIKDCFFDSYGFLPAKKFPKYLKIKHQNCIHPEYQIQKEDIYCASYCLYIHYLTKVLGIDFKTSVLNLYYQRFSYY